MPGLIDAALLTEANVTLNMMFREAYDRPIPMWMNALADTVSSGGHTQKYPIMGKLTSLRPWKGERRYDSFSRYAYELENETFEKSLEVGVNDINDDQLGGYSSLMGQLAYQASIWPQQQVAAALKAGESGPCFDGKFFFDTDHPIDPNAPSVGLYDNLFASSALTATTFRSVLAAMQLIKNVDGEPMGFDDGSALRLIVPPQLSAVASGIVEAPFLTGGATNVNAGLAKVLVLPQLGGDATSWYLAQTEGQTKPLLWQLRQSPILASLVNINDPNVFELDVFRWGLKARGVAGYGMPWLMAKCKA